MHSSSCILLAVYCVVFALNFHAIAAASVSGFASADIGRSDPAYTAASVTGEQAAPALHAPESPRQARQALYAGAYPIYGGYNGAVNVVYRKPYYTNYGFGYPLTYGEHPQSYGNGGYTPYNSYPRVLYG